MSAEWGIKREADEHPGWKTALLGGGVLSREDDVAAGAVVAPSLRLKRRGDSGGPVSGALLEVKLEGSDSRHRADIHIKEEEAEVFGGAKERLKLVDGEYRPRPRDLHVVEAGLRFPGGVLRNPAADCGSAARPRAPRTEDAAAVAASSSGSAEIEVILEDDDGDVSLARRRRTGRRTGNEGPQHRCPVCGKCYRHASKLRNHARVHTGEKPLACHVCGKAFAWPSGLRYHLVLHQGGRVLACPVCGTSFVRSSDLYAHVSGDHAPLPQQKQQLQEQQQKQQQQQPG
uniref:Zinc finger protein 497-like isoform X1 n=1 Tax=Petromyzon marinus TaxID=7757 RepID=A0AAJ7UG17_PETMA|nr:zinc finger protein 497-like isoform X1 [Petromyzon marinus]XP_032835796.1 zinc finger protein 497-like isoform X1 [Petromyzon marinus]